MIANIRELRSSTKEILSAVSRGDTVVITHRGKPYAKIIPISPKAKSKNHTNEAAFGMWKNNRKVKSIKKFITQLRKGRYAR